MPEWNPFGPHLPPCEKSDGDPQIRHRIFGCIVLINSTLKEIGRHPDRRSRGHDRGDP